MAQSPEQELADFLAPLPQWLQKSLWFVALTDLESFSSYDSHFPFTADQLEELKTTAGGWQPERYPRTLEELRPQFEQILQRCALTMWETYCANARAARRLDADSHVQMPRRNRGRKPETDLAERIWILKDEGKTVPEMQAIFEAENQHFSQEKIEAYLKSRRRKQQQ
jgi:hypothetical protein